MAVNIIKGVTFPPEPVPFKGFVRETEKLAEQYVHRIERLGQHLLAAYARGDGPEIFGVADVLATHIAALRQTLTRLQAYAELEHEQELYEQD